MSTTPVVANQFSIAIDQVSDFEFRVKFDKENQAELLVDEPPPLGKDAGPSASRLLAAAIGNCLSASFLFCTRRAKLNLTGIHADVRTEVVRNAAGRLRIGRVVVEIDPKLSDTDREQARRCAAIFDDYCTVTAAVRQGIPVEVTIKGM